MGAIGPSASMTGLVMLGVERASYARGVHAVISLGHRTLFSNLPIDRNQEHFVLLEEIPLGASGAPA
jgi:hypothetical protein